MNVKGGPVEIPSSMKDTFVFEGAFKGRMNVGTRACNTKDEALKRNVTETGVATKLGSSESGLLLSEGSLEGLELILAREGGLTSSASLLGKMLVPLCQVPFPPSKTLLGGAEHPGHGEVDAIQASGGS